MASTERTEVPSAVYVACPECAEETLHTVLKGTVGTRGGYVLDATVSCSECGRVHHVVMREAPDREVAVVVSEREASRRATVTLGADDEVKVDDLVLVEGANVLVTAIETHEGRRVERAKVATVKTIWGKAYDQVVVKFGINLGQKTITKQVAAKPEDVFNVGDEHVFGRLRVTIHSIKTKERLLRRGSASAGDIARVFAKPTPPDAKPYRPEKPVRERLRRDTGDPDPPRSPRFRREEADDEEEEL